MALDRRELLRRIGMGGLATALTPMAGLVAPARSDGMVALPVSQEVELVPATVITPELVQASNFDGWALVAVSTSVSCNSLTRLVCEFVYVGGGDGYDPLDDLRGPRRNSWDNLSRKALRDASEAYGGS